MISLFEHIVAQLENWKDMLILVTLQLYIHFFKNSGFETNNSLKKLFDNIEVFTLRLDPG